jgi:serine/threonine protein kinase
LIQNRIKVPVTVRITALLVEAFSPPPAPNKDGHPNLCYKTKSNFVTIAPTSETVFHCVAPAVDVEGFLVIGKTFGHYQITSQLGKGSMGEVFQAKDPMSGRDAAIKVPPEKFAKDVGRVARFRREVKLLAYVNRTNIAAIHGLEEPGGINSLALNWVEELKRRVPVR